MTEVSGNFIMWCSGEIFSQFENQTQNQSHDVIFYL